jgi:hypothetical protein
MKVVLIDKVKELNLCRITKKEWERTLVVEEKDFDSFDVFGMAFYHQEIRNYWIIRTTNEEVINECEQKGAKIWRTKTSKSFLVEVKNPSGNLARIVSALSNNGSEKHRDDIAIRVLLGLNMLNQSKGTYVEKDIAIERAFRHAIAIIRNPDLFFAIQKEEEEERKALLERAVKEEQEEKQEKNTLDAIKKKLMQIIDIINIKTKEN